MSYYIVGGTEQLSSSAAIAKARESGKDISFQRPEGGEKGNWTYLFNLETEQLVWFKYLPEVSRELHDKELFCSVLERDEELPEYFKRPQAAITKISDGLSEKEMVAWCKEKLYGKS